ncbi:MAG TPA: SMC family ATPase [Euzebyales bacterium]|nr:SMC family ATPase [Euzebyales bacterium]
MRPTRLELTGFGSFREPATVDFADTDLFVLVGPTGAGKSTVIDAMIFALYGSVPRYDDRRLVAPVINQGRVEAKVRLDFVVDGSGYTAVRVVRRTQAGATTKEARLERWDPADPQRSDGNTTTLAGNEKELTERVEKLLGLSFDHFTRCVVLPQGAFAQFLHARSGERQNLLVDLLGIEVYRRIGRRARERAKQAQTRVEHTRRRLDGELAPATAGALTAAEVRVGTLEELQVRIADAQPELERLRERGAQLRAAATNARQRRELLDGLEQPAAVASLARRLADAAQAEADAAARVEKGEQQRQAAEAARGRLPDGAVVTELQRLVAERDARQTQLGPATDELHTALAARTAADVAHEDARRALASARATRDQVREANFARALAQGLEVGDDCPVCAQPVTTLPAHGDAGDLDAADAAHAAAEQQVTRTAAALRAADAEVARRQHAHDGLVGAHDGLVTSIDELADAHALALNEVPRVATAIAQADRDVADARAEEQTARAALRQAAVQMRGLDSHRRAAWTQFDTARDPLAGLGPPPVERDDLAGSWAQLLAWASERRPVLADTADAAERAVEDVAQQWRARNGELVAACVAVEVPVEGTDPRSACVAALERARGTRARIAEAVETAERLRAEVRDDEQLAEAATALGQHLGAKRFEQWLLNQALAQLVADASIRLRELSSKAYSLQVDDSGAFMVVDHRNADELRSARTLSGGETFLASLSLALSLADHVAQLATGTSARLDALYLDEGFGTLDHDTLDVVAAALEELGSQGRTVGLVTHVRELAERMPMRFEVRRTGETSTVERVEA